TKKVTCVVAEASDSKQFISITQAPNQKKNYEDLRERTNWKYDFESANQLELKIFPVKSGFIQLTGNEILSLGTEVSLPQLSKLVFLQRGRREAFFGLQVFAFLP
ncbi:unnamed protein product, partial [Rodentolepis nana]|uniref:Tub domain-containing protein n=1 Tax=Rodentolepis nana TaxID=102285 RepID=A0A0R3TYM9_RODNA